MTDPWDPYACKGIYTIDFRVFINVLIELLCGNGVIDENEQCDGGVGCTPFCECKEPTWIPQEPTAIDCERRKILYYCYIINDAYNFNNKAVEIYGWTQVKNARSVQGAMNTRAGARENWDFIPLILLH